MATFQQGILTTKMRNDPIFFCQLRPLLTFGHFFSEMKRGTFPCGKDVFTRRKKDNVIELGTSGFVLWQKYHMYKSFSSWTWRLFVVCFLTFETYKNRAQSQRPVIDCADAHKHMLVT